MIVIVGESGSGKSTLAKHIQRIGGYKKVVTYTTRPMREGEVDGVDYHFVSEDMFKEIDNADNMMMVADYRGWMYGTAKSDLKDDGIIIVTPSGLRELKEAGIKMTSIYLYVDRRARLIQLLNRGDDIEEAYRRNLTDVGQFDSINKEVDIVLCNKNYEKSPEELASQVLNFARRA